MKLPNGYGSVIKLAGNRRNPYAARITSGWTPEGKQVFKYIGYYPTKKEALTALAGYNSGIVPGRATIAELWDIWSARKFDNLSASAVRVYKGAYKHLEPFHDRDISSIKQIELQRLVDTLTPYTARNAVMVLRQLYRLALANDYCTKDVSALLELPKAEKSDMHQPFTEDELDALKAYWKRSGDAYAAVWLVLIYTGIRPGELFDRKPDEVSDDAINITKAKNRNSVRVVPVPDQVRPLIDALPPLPVHYNTAKRNMANALQAAGIRQHLPHDGRHTFASRWKMQGLDPELCRAIMGHAGRDINEDVYTHYGQEKMRDEMNRLK